VNGLRRIHSLAIAIAEVGLIAAVPLIVTHCERPGNVGFVDAAPTAVRTASSAPVPAPPCVACGEIVAIRTLREDSEGSGVGAVTGDVLGGVLGHQIGAGRGKEALAAPGVIGGALGGNEVGKQAKAMTLHLIDVPRADGSARTVSQSTLPILAIGMRVEVADNTIVPR